MRSSRVAAAVLALAHAAAAFKPTPTCPSAALRRAARHGVIMSEKKESTLEKIIGPKLFKSVTK